MSDPTITDKAVTERECSWNCGAFYPTRPNYDLINRHEREDHTTCPICGEQPRNPYPVAHLAGCERLSEIRRFEADWEAKHAAALPHLADQPATTGDDAARTVKLALVEAVHGALQLDALTAAAVALSGEDPGWVETTVNETLEAAILDSVVARVLPLLARQSADRDTETAALRDRLDRLVRDRDAALTLAADQGQQHRDEIAKLRAELVNVREMLIAEHVHTTRGCGHDVGPMEVEGASECSHCGTNYGATEFCPGRCDVVRVERDHATASRRGGE